MPASCNKKGQRSAQPQRFGDTDMNILFCVIAATMVFVAMSFVLRPLALARSPQNRGFAQLPLLAVLLVILLAIGLYLALGRPDAAGPSAELPLWPQEGVQQNPAPAAHKKNLGSVASLIDGLAEKLQREPDDGGGWLLLAKSYKHLGRLEDARTAYAKAEDLGESDASLESSLNAASPTGDSIADETGL